MRDSGDGFQHRIIGSEPVVVVDAHAGDGSAVDLPDVAGAQFALVPTPAG